MNRLKTIALCGRDYKPVIVLGNVNNSSIKEIWTSNYLEEIRGKLLDKNYDGIEICKGCRIWDLEIRTIWNKKC